MSLGGSRASKKEVDMKTFIRMLRDESGASAAEYALILAIIGTGIAIAAIALGSAISSAMDSASQCVDGTTAACRPPAAPAA